MPTPIFHLTCVANLGSIVGSGGLLSDAEVQRRALAPARIGYADLKERRLRTPVPVGPGGSVGDYVPFFFGPRPPMLYALWRGLVSGTDSRQSDVVHLVSTVEAVVESGFAFAFTNGHAVMAMSDFFDDLSHLDKVDWPLMTAKMWNDTDADPDRKRRRQAEFLVHRSMPWTLIHSIGVMTPTAAEQVAAAIGGSAHQPVVDVRSNWYY